MEQQTAQIIDLGATKAKAALKRIAESTKRTREDWREYGAELLEALRLHKNSRPLFGQWIVKHGLDVAPAEHATTRSDAMWLAEHWVEVESYLTGAGKMGVTNPKDIRQACRDAGLPCAAPALRTAPNAPKIDGWTRQVELAIGGTLPLGYARNTLAHDAAKREEVEVELGHPIKSRCTLDEARPIAEAIKRLAARTGAPTAPDEWRVKYEALLVEHKALQAKFDELNKYAMVYHLNKPMTDKLSERVKELEAALAKGVDEAKLRLDTDGQLKRALEKQRAEFLGGGWVPPKKITQDQRFKQLLQLCHPDKHHGSASAVAITQWLLKLRG